MRRAVVTAIVILFVIGGLYAAMAVRAPKSPPPTTEDIWRKEGIPIEVDRIIRGDMERTVEVTGDIDALNKVTLSAKIAGRVAQVFGREGDAVSKDGTVVLLDQQDASTNVRQAEAGLQAARIRLSQAATNAKVTRIQTDAAIQQAKEALAAAEARLAVVKKPARTQDEMMAENNLASARANLDNAEANYKRLEKLLKDGAISQSAFDVARTQYVVAQSQFRSAQEQLSLLKEGGRAEDVEAARAQVSMAKQQLRTAEANAAQNLLREEDVRQAKAALTQAEAALAMAKQQLSYTAVKSPISGQLASRLTEPGQVVAPGQPLAELVNLGSLYFRGDLSEKELLDVRKGQPVEVRVDAIPNRVFRGVVEELYPAASTQSRSFPVRIGIRQAGSRIRPGMFARGSIVTGIDRNVLLVPKDAIEERRGTKMVFAIDAKKVARRHDVTVVRENTDYVQIAVPTGLKVGDIVATRGRQNVQDGSLVCIEKCLR